MLLSGFEPYSTHNINDYIASLDSQPFLAGNTDLKKKCQKY
jgi:hypothetical protein